MYSLTTTPDMPQGWTVLQKDAEATAAKCSMLLCINSRADKQENPYRVSAHSKLEHVCRTIHRQCIL